MSDLPELSGRLGKRWEMEFEEFRKSLSEEVGLTPGDAQALVARHGHRLRLAWLAANERETSTLRQAMALLGPLYLAGITLFVSLTRGLPGDVWWTLMPVAAGGAVAFALIVIYIVVNIFVVAPANRVSTMRDELLANGCLKDSQGDSGGQPHSRQSVVESKESTAPLTNAPRYGAVLRKLVRRVRRHG